MIETAENIADMPMCEFIELCSHKNVTELDAIIRVLLMMKSDVTLALIGFNRDMKKKVEDKEEITVEAMEEYATRIASIGGMMRIMEEKAGVAKQFHYALTPSCFLESKTAETH